MELTEKKLLDEDDKLQILKIWNAVYPKTLYYSEISEFDKYLASLSDAHHYVFKNNENQIQAWSCKFIRESEKWFVLILDDSIHGKGNGTNILNTIKNNESKLNAWVIDEEIFEKSNNEIYKSPLNFYLKNDFILCEEIRIHNEKLSAVKIIWNKKINPNS